MAAGNNSLEETFGLVAAGTEILRQPGRVANGLSTITARLTKKNDEYIKSITGGQGVIDAQTGELRSTMAILKDLSQAWEDLTSVEKQELTETVAGKTQRALFTALMTNFDTAVGATEAALNSEGSALEENNKRMNSLHGRLTQLNTAWQDFSRNTIDSEGVKAILSLGTAIVKFADSDMGRFTMAITAAIIAQKLWNKAMATKTVISLSTALKQQLLTAITGVTVAFNAGAISGGVFGGVLSAIGAILNGLKIALLSNPLFMGIAAAAGIYAIVKAVDALNVSFEEQVEKADEAAKSYKEAKDNLEKNNKTLEEKKKQLEEINKLEEKDNSGKYDNQKRTLEGEISVLEAKQKVLEKIAEEEKKAAQKEAEKTLTAKTTINEYKDEGTTTASGRAFKETDVTIIEKINKEISNYNELLKQQQNAQKATFESDDAFAKRKENLQNKLDETKKSILDTSNTLLDLRDKFDTSTESGKKYVEQIDEAVQEGLDFTDSLKNQTDNLSLQEEYIKGVREEEEELRKARVEDNSNEILEQTKNYLADIDIGEDNLINTTEDYINVVNALKNEIDLLNSAYKEQAEDGSVSLDTALDLIAANADYINYLSIEDGQIRINAGAQQLLNQQKIATAQQNIILANLDLIGKYANEENATKDLASAYVELANAKAAAAAAGDATAASSLENVQKQINLIKSLEANPVFKGGKQTGVKSRAYTPKSSKKSSKSKGKSSKEKYKAEIDTLYNYENALDNAKDAVDRLNDALKNTDNFNEREKYLKQLINATKDEIEATNDLRKAQTRQINDYIKQLRKQGFQISYNSKTNELNINNMERLGKFSGDTAKNLEKMIKKIQDLNKDNRSLSGSVRDLNADIEDFNEQLEELPTEKLEKFNELMEKFQKSRLDQIQNQIDDIENEMKNDPRLKALEAQIEALEKQNDELDSQKELEEKILAVEQAKQKLENQRKQKTIQVYREGQGFVWEADIDAIQDAADELKDAQDDLNDKIKQDQLDQLNAEKDALEKSYQDRIDALQNFLDDQNYLIDKANREGIQTFAELQKQMAKFGLDNAENLKKATDWLNNYNKSLSDLNQTVSGILSSSTKATDGLIYSSKTQDRINSALSSIMPNLDTSTGLTLSNVRTEATDKEKSNSIYINSIELPNVKDIDDFIKALQDLPRMASSQSTLRK